ncbi:hypothetical protein RJT34_32032 [Clitoria ternatea]|uniref:Uncharacterized protein n=1 Tax=Clitoria ternatea TaxID=43366 RepID=A0AAN9F356_CLITE
MDGVMITKIQRRRIFLLHQIHICNVALPNGNEHFIYQITQRVKENHKTNTKVTLPLSPVCLISSYTVQLL